MKPKPTTFVSTLLLLMALGLSSCGASSSAIATAVALTVQAQSTPTPLPVTDTPLAEQTDTPIVTNSPVVSPTLGTPLPLPQPHPGTSAYCTSAHFVADVTYPDGSVVLPGDSFFKTWRIQNSGTCTWTTAYRIVYDHGDIMGGGYSYNMPQQVPPGGTVDITLQFYAPSDLGMFASYWDLETPDGVVFGLDQYQVPFSVRVNVNSGTPGWGTKSVYGIASVVYSVSQRNGCSDANIFFTTTATISTTGPYKFDYYWRQSDGGKTIAKQLNFTTAGSMTVTDTWPMHLGHTVGTYYDMIVINWPIFRTYDKGLAPINYTCQ